MVRSSFPLCVAGGLASLLLTGLPLCAQDAIIGESDRNFLALAENACRTGDAMTFFQAMAGSALVRQSHVAARVTVETVAAGTDPPQVLRRTQVAGADYTGFPVAPMDYGFVPVAPLVPGDRDEAVMLEMQDEADGGLSVRWTRVHFRGPAEGDDPGQPFDAVDGGPYDPARRSDGLLRFAPASGCWALVADTRLEARP